MTSHDHLLLSIRFAARAHGGQARKDIEETPYIVHPLDVMLCLRQYGHNDIQLLQAAVLHDVVEDTAVDPQDISDLFGDTVARIVREVTDDKSLPLAERRREQVRRAGSASPEAKLVKLADKLCNVLDMDADSPVGWDSRRKVEYIDFATAVVERCQDADLQMASRYHETAREKRQLFEAL